MRVLLVEDDAMIGAALVERPRGRRVRRGLGHRRTRRSAQPDTHDYDVVLLDLGLPGMTGAEMLARLRATGDDTPVIVVTARDEVDDRVSGLDLGADDYVVKPFEATELMARMRAVLRRRGAEHLDVVLTNGRVNLDVARHRAWLSDDTEVDLSKREFAVLRALLTRPGIILSRRGDRAAGLRLGPRGREQRRGVRDPPAARQAGGRHDPKRPGVGWVVPKDGSGR